MRKIRIYSIFVMLLLGLVACEKGHTTTTTSKSGIDGEWKLESYYGADAGSSAVPAEVYISFSGGRFELFQKLGGHFERYFGTYSYDGETVTGTYSDGQNWMSGYLVSFSDDGRMRMSQYVNDEEYACVYARTSIPASVRKDASDFGKVRSSGVGETAPWL